MKNYHVNEVFGTLQGEGVNAGRAAVFVRFAGCNLWSGHPQHRKDPRNGACAQWCDTDFRTGAAMTAADIVEAMEHHAPPPAPLSSRRLCVITGGEPLLQLDAELVGALKNNCWEVAVETNGTIESDALMFVDHVTVSPKIGQELKVTRAEELKVVVPGASSRYLDGWTPELLKHLEMSGHWERMYVQPQDPLLSRDVADTVLHPLGSDRAMVAGVEADYVPASEFATYEGNVERCIEFVRENPAWRLSLQTHKLTGLP